MRDTTGARGSQLVSKTCADVYADSLPKSITFLTCVSDSALLCSAFATSCASAASFLRHRTNSARPIPALIQNLLWVSGEFLFIFLPLRRLIFRVSFALRTVSP